MNERIKELRKALKLSQEKFGARIKISGASVSKIESGENNPSEQTLSLIIAEFAVSESWLRNGEGDMFIRTTESAVEALVKKFSFPEIVGKLLYTYDSLETDKQAVVLEYAQKFIANMITEDALTVAASVAAYPEEKEARSYIAERIQETSSVSKNGNAETA